MSLREMNIEILFYLSYNNVVIAVLFCIKNVLRIISDLLFDSQVTWESRCVYLKKNFLQSNDNMSKHIT